MTRLKEEADGRTAKLSNDLTALQTELSQTISARDAAQNQARMLTEKLGMAQKEIENLTLARTDVESRASNLRQQLSAPPTRSLTWGGATEPARSSPWSGLAQLSTLPKT
jgi:uncharacterized coiled-coil DUF342 family protein